ncbi:MAG: VOC family protein [Longimicrobiales bacterium]
MKDLDVSVEFQEKPRFKNIEGAEEHYIIVKNRTAVVGLFQGMFEKSILTSNPGLSPSVEQLADFLDIQTIRKRPVADGAEVTADLDPGNERPASPTFVGHDENPVLIDSFFPKSASGASYLVELARPSTRRASWFYEDNARRPRGMHDHRSSA